ncbi:MAG: DEAD/DEAH box helicase family protein [Dehalococcoidia bacterium]|nr:DEAD/DEAH box helicase family protein [Dehalococcoidia bacterium]
MASSIPVPADLLADPNTIESREVRYPLYVHSEVVDEMVRRDSLKRRMSLVLQHLAARGRTGVVKSCVKQENRGWRRTPMGGNHGSQFYLWWTHGGSGVMPEPMGLRRSVWIRALRHHDNMTRLAPGDPEKDYLPLVLRDITGDDDEFAQRPWTAQQTGFIESEAPIRIIYGHPGSGKTTSLWQSVNARSGERVLYTSWSRELVAQAEEPFASFASASSEVLAYDYQTIIGMSCGYDVARLTHARRLSLLEGAIRDAHLQRRLLGPWFDRTPELYAEIRSYLLGMAAGQYPTLHGPEELSRLTRDSYLALRGRFNDERVTDSLMRVFSALERAERLGDIFPDMLAASRARARLEEGILPDGFESLDRIVMDEIQDLTLLEMSVFTVLARAIGRRRGRLPWLLLSGDEGQTVLPTGFDWGPVSSLVARELRAPREFGLDEKLRAPGRLSEVVERASSIYLSLNRSLRPSNQQVREVSDVLEARLYYVAARDEREASWLLERLSQIEGVAIITTAHAPPTWTPDAVRSLILTPQSAKGLEYPTVCVLDPGATLAELSAPKSEYSTAKGIETQMLRTSIDRFRVAVSRSTETLVFLDVGPDESISALSRHILGDSISCAPELLLEYLTPSDALPEDLALARIRESRELLDGAPAAAWNRAAQAVPLLGRPGIPNGIADEEVRRDVHHNLMVVGCRVVTDAPEADLGDVKRLCMAGA